MDHPLATPLQAGSAPTELAPGKPRRTKYTILVDDATRAYQRRLRACTDVRFSEFLRALVAYVATDPDLEAKVLASLGHPPVESPSGHDSGDVWRQVDAAALNVEEPLASADDEGFWE